jgi:glycerol-3-phosphate dehydrogenase
MAREAVDRICAFLASGETQCLTAWKRLDNMPRLSVEAFLEKLGKARPGAGSPDRHALLHLLKTYGGRAFEVLTIANKEYNKIHPDFDLLWAELEYAATREMACSLTDFMVRRSHLGYLMDVPDERMVEQIAIRMGAVLGWTRRDKDIELDRYWTWDRNMRAISG